MLSNSILFSNKLKQNVVMCTPYPPNPKKFDCVVHHFVHISLVEIVRRLIYFKIIAIWKHSERKCAFYHLRRLYYWYIFSISLQNRVIKRAFHLSLMAISLPCFPIIFPIIYPTCIIPDQNIRSGTIGSGCHQNVQFISENGCDPVIFTNNFIFTNPSLLTSFSISSKPYTK